MPNQDAIKYLEVKIRTYERRIGRLNAEMDALRVGLSRTETLLNSAKTLLKDELGGQGRLNQNQKVDQTLSERISVLSMSDAITEIVNSNPGPIHADQVLKRLREAGRTPRAKNPKNSVVSMLHKGVKAGLYSKVGPNLFARLNIGDEL